MLFAGSISTGPESGCWPWLGATLDGSQLMNKINNASSTRPIMAVVLVCSGPGTPPERIHHGESETNRKSCAGPLCLVFAHSGVKNQPGRPTSTDYRPVITSLSPLEPIITGSNRLGM